MIEKSILLIDDERRMTESLRGLLTAAGLRVATANSGQEGIEALEQEHYPVVVTDLRMQGVDGLHVVRYVHEHCPKTLVIVITGYASTDSAIEALRYQAFDYIRKPFEFDRLKGAIDRAFQKLEVDQLREDTAAMITHDIKVPLTSIIGFASLLHDPRTGQYHPRGPEFIGTIRANAQRILALVDNYLTTCRIDSDSLVIHPTTVSLKHLLEEILGFVSHEAARRGLRIETDVAVDPPEAVFDESTIYRAVANLVQNAVKYGDPAEPIRIGVERLTPEASPLAEASLKFEVVNAAPQVQPSQLPGLFGRFKRLGKDRGIEGSGIGLYVVDQVARAHGGLAEARCLEGGRVAFAIILPAEPHPARDR